jgi:hypothetical protein
VFVETSSAAEHYFATYEAIVEPGCLVGRRWYLVVVEKDLKVECHEAVANGLEDTRCFDFVVG